MIIINLLDSIFLVIPCSTTKAATLSSVPLLSLPSPFSFTPLLPLLPEQSPPKYFQKTDSPLLSPFPVQPQPQSLLPFHSPPKIIYFSLFPTKILVLNYYHCLHQYICSAMFFCCQVPEKGNHVFEMFQTPASLSVVSQAKSMKLRAHINANRPIVNSKVINNITNNPKGNDLNSITNFIHNEYEEEDYALKKIMKSNYERLVEEYKRTNKMWTDPDFPPEQKSFGVGKEWEKVNWKRIGDIIKNPVFIGDNIDPGDILQGRIGDCYFLSAIAGLAEYSERIKILFPNFEINKNGIYMARVLYRGVLREVVVDDYFPVSKKDGNLMVANPSGGNEIWVMILQKCWAKLYGSYEAIDGGLPNEVLHAFSAAPIFQYTQQDDEVFNEILKSNEQKHVICSGTNSDESVEDMGLVLGHAYTVVEVFDRPRKLLKIRNPWGEKEWTGRASDSDKQFWSKVSASDKQRLGYSQKNDGIFFMFWEDYVEYFQVINICKVNDKANYYYQELVYPKDVPVFSVMVTKGGTTTIQITQSSTRGKEVPSPRYATAVLIVAKKVSNKGKEDYEYISSFTERNVCDANEELLGLTPGEYIIYSSLSGRNAKEQATLSCYCESPIQISPTTQINTEQFLHRIFLDHARKNKESQQKIFGDMDVWVCMDIIYQSGFGYTVIHIGPSVKYKFGLTFNEEQYTENNFELLPPYKGARTFNIVCTSGQDTIVLCKIIPKGHAVEASMPIPNIKRLS